MRSPGDATRRARIMESNCKNMEALKKRVRDRLALPVVRKDAESLRCALKKRGEPVPMAIIREVLAEGNPIVTATESPSATAGYSIGLSGVRVAMKKPNEGMKAKIFQLKRGRGFPVDALAAEWFASPDTIITHARRLDALRYVEVNPGEWVQCVMHPDTAAQYGN